MATAKKKPSLLDAIAAYDDVAEELVNVPEWGGVDILFRGMTFAALEQMQDIDLQAAEKGELKQVVKLLQATACDPDTKLPVFEGDKGLAVLRQKNYEVLLRLVNEGSLVVLGVDEKETAGKG